MKIRIDRENGYDEYYDVPERVGRAIIDLLDEWENMQEKIDDLKEKGGVARKDTKPGEWIPIGEKLPEVDEDGISNPILISFEGHSYPAVGAYIKDDEGGAFCEGETGGIRLGEGCVVNAWMPLLKCCKEAER